MAGPTAEEVLRTLQSIDSRLGLIVAHFGIGARPVAAQGSAGPSGGSVASDRDLDSQYGNPEVKAKSPRDWTGESQQGKRFSECPPEYLLMVADRLDYFADQNRAAAEDQQTPPEQVSDLLKKAKYNRIDASRARGWAARLRAGWKPPVAEAFGTDAGAPVTDDQVPF